MLENAFRTCLGRLLKVQSLTFVCNEVLMRMFSDIFINTIKIDY